MILDQFKLDGKAAIVTGSARGLGQAIALGLAEAGANVALVDILDMVKTKTQIEKMGLWAIEFAQFSLKLFADIVRAPFTDFTEKDWDDVMNINIRGLFFLSQAVVKVMAEQGRGGKIINTASMLSFQGGILVPSYTSSKSAVMGLTRLMACELAKHNINTNAIAPGYMATDNTKPLRDDPVRNRAILDRIPAGRWGRPEDLQGVAVFLASSASDYMNGYTIAVDGGWLAR